MIRTILLLSCIAGLLLVFACKSDPVIPAGGIPLPDPVQDPGVEDLCPQGVISFQHEILPLMISGCAYSGCHDAASAEDDIILDSYENIIKEVSPGDPNNSELYESIIETDPNDIMPPPPHAPLTSVQIELVKNWILQGAENTTCGTACDTTQTSYAAHIFPLLQIYCTGCHSPALAEAGVRLDTYDEVKIYVASGSLIGSIRHEPLYAIMPPGGSKMSACRIRQIEKWIEEGALNN